jgi:UDP-glucose 4-epimerase
VTGGAGFIGAHVVHLLSARQQVVVFDDLSTGRLDRLPPVVEVVKGSVTNRNDLDQLFATHPATGVVHLAARKIASESAAEAEFYRRDNVEGVKHLVAAMRQARVGRLLFASSAAVYGDTSGEPVHERRAPRPTNRYGLSKLEGERIIAAAPGLRSLVFRKFNVVGAGAHPYAVDTGPTSLLPAVFQALTDGRELVVRGRDYPTYDGSAVRDYVDVTDIARAYVHGVDRLLKRRYLGRRHRVVNLGSGVGTSVLDLVMTAGRAAAGEVPFHDGPRRAGDAAAVVADVTRARRAGLGSRHTVAEAVASAWASWQKYVVVETPGVGPTT